MLRKSIQMLYLCILLMFTQLLVWGCAPQVPVSTTPKPVTKNVCEGGMPEQVAELSADDIGEFLSRADSDGGVSCWNEAVKAALAQGKPIERTQLVRALDVFNHNASVGNFHRAVGQYLRNLTDESTSYTEDDRRLLEAYSRYVIRTSRSLEDDNLKLAQMACARLDRPLYKRLFE